VTASERSINSPLRDAAEPQRQRSDPGWIMLGRCTAHAIEQRPRSRHPVRIERRSARDENPFSVARRSAALARKEELITRRRDNRAKNRLPPLDQRRANRPVLLPREIGPRAVDRIDDPDALPREPGTIVCSFLGEPAVVWSRRSQPILQQLID